MNICICFETNSYTCSVTAGHLPIISILWINLETISLRFLPLWLCCGLALVPLGNNNSSAMAMQDHDWYRDGFTEGGGGGGGQLGCRDADFHD